VYATIVAQIYTGQSSDRCTTVRDWTLCMQLVSCCVLYHFIAGCVYCIILSKPVSSSFVVTPLFKCMIAVVLALSHVV